MGKHILIVDTNHIARAGLRAILMNDPYVSQVDESTSSEDLKKHLTISSSIHVLIHQSLVTDMKIFHEGQCFIILASELDKNILMDSYQHGVRAYLSEKPSLELLLRSLHLQQGEFLLDPTFTPWILNATSKDIIPSVDIQSLTTREQEIFDLLRSGLTYRSIAEQLSIALPTVKTHVAHIFRKLKIKRRPGKVFRVLER